MSTGAAIGTPDTEPIVRVAPIRLTNVDLVTRDQDDSRLFARIRWQSA